MTQKVPDGFNNVSPADLNEVIKGMVDVVRRLQRAGLVKELPKELQQAAARASVEPPAS